MYRRIAVNAVVALTLFLGLIACNGVAKEANVKVSQRQLYTDGLGEKGIYGFQVNSSLLPTCL